MWALALGVRRALSAGFAVVIVLACAGVANAQGGAYTRYVAESASFVTYSLSAAVSSGSLSLKINISGKITEQTVTEVSKAVSMLKEMGKIARADNPQLVDNEWPLEVSLWSAGGSVDAAIEIGRLLRSLDATVEVSQEIVCESSCVLILAGGTKRRMKGYIGIHRPYFETWTKSPTTAEVSVAMGRMRDKLVAYLSDMNVDRALADDMMKIAPENIRYLTQADLNRYGLLERDPVAEEAAALKEASKYGPSRSDYMMRKVRIKEVCPKQHKKSYADCEADIFSGRL